VPLITVLPVLFGAFVLVASPVVATGALPGTPGKVLLGVSIAAFFVTALAAIGRDAASDRITASLFGSSPADEALVEEPDSQQASEAEQVERWRRRRLAALGVADTTAMILAAEREFSVHDLERLIATGCPLGTALRILDPA
jgi:hypothetical protein